MRERSTGPRVNKSTGPESRAWLVDLSTCWLVDHPWTGPVSCPYQLTPMYGFDGYADLLGSLGKHSTGKSCLYIKRLEQVDGEVLRRLIEESVAHTASSAQREPSSSTIRSRSVLAS
jgi:hypothetical protein